MNRTFLREEYLFSIISHQRYTQKESAYKHLMRFKIILMLSVTAKTVPGGGGVLSGTRISKALPKIHDGHRCHTAASVKATLKRRFKKTAAIKPNGRISSERPEITI